MFIPLISHILIVELSQPAVDVFRSKCNFIINDSIHEFVAYLGCYPKIDYFSDSHEHL